jgi:hypothetical protein
MKPRRLCRHGRADEEVHDDHDDGYSCHMNTFDMDEYSTDAQSSDDAYEPYVRKPKQNNVRTTRINKSRSSSNNNNNMSLIRSRKPVPSMADENLPPNVAHRKKKKPFQSRQPHVA